MEEMTDIHSCSYYCTRPPCVLAQRNELRDKLLAEREACADVVEQAGIEGHGTLAAAAMIRARGKTDV
jgi:hypothetical protein